MIPSDVSSTTTLPLRRAARSSSARPGLNGLLLVVLVFIFVVVIFRLSGFGFTFAFRCFAFCGFSFLGFALRLVFVLVLGFAFDSPPRGALPILLFIQRLDGADRRVPGAGSDDVPRQLLLITQLRDKLAGQVVG